MFNREPALILAAVQAAIAGRQTRAVLDLLWLAKFGSVPT